VNLTHALVGIVLRTNHCLIPSRSVRCRHAKADFPWEPHPSCRAINRPTATKDLGTAHLASLAHDAEGRLRQTAINGAVTNLLYDGPFLVAEYDGAGNPIRRYVPGPGIDEPLVQLDIANNVVTARTWLHADHLGSIVAESNGVGTRTAVHAYGPYGEPGTAPGQSLPERFGYTGQQYLAGLNLYHYKARTYSPTLGRFIETDPLGMPDGTNRYSYVGNNPVNFTDPSGLYWFRQAWQTEYVVGRVNSPVVPGEFVSRVIEDYVPAGRTFGDMHDALVNTLTATGVPDLFANVPTMIPTYGVAVVTEVLRSAGILEQPTPPTQESQSPATSPRK
jgi:RHS repeat-associated protein